MASAAETHLFNATLSLTGNCETSPVDEVPDPGCPGGEHPPLGGFASPATIATDGYGDVFVASRGANTDRSEGRIDVFDSTGHFITEVARPGVVAIAVDKEGHLYAVGHLLGEESELVRYDPTTFNPGAGEIAYEDPPTVVLRQSEGLPPESGSSSGFGVDVTDGHVFVVMKVSSLPKKIIQLGSAAEGNPTISSFEYDFAKANKIAVDGSTETIYVAEEDTGNGASRVRVFNYSGTLLRTITGFKSEVGEISPAIEEETGNLFVADMSAPVPATKPKLYELPPGATSVGEAIATVEHEIRYVFNSMISIDNGASSPNKGFLWVPSQKGTDVGHAFGFEPKKEITLPEVESVAVQSASDTEASVGALINPGNGETEYSFQIISQSAYELAGGSFAGARTFATGTIAPSDEGQPRSASVAGLAPGTAYRVRAVAENEKGEDAKETTFATYLAPVGGGGCPNEALRTGPSAILPDCRAFEIVTPPDTGGHVPAGVEYVGDQFDTAQASADGSLVSWLSFGGTIPGAEGTGSLNGDPYLSARGAGGWQTAAAGPSGGEVEVLLPGSVSADQRHLFWTAGLPAAAEGIEPHYLRYPDGSSSLVGRGSLGTDPLAAGLYISEGAGHVIFASSSEAPQLEPDAPPAGTAAVYDRTADGTTHVASLLPGNVTPAGGEDARFIAASKDGSAVAFLVGSSLYLRRDDAVTYLVASGGYNAPKASSPTPGGFTPAGLSADGSRVFYEQEGNLFAFDANTESTLPLATSGDATFVNVPAAGSRVYFASPTVLTGSEANPAGQLAQAGQPNLYLTDGAATTFVATLTEEDLEGHYSSLVGWIDGLGLWSESVRARASSVDPSKTTPGGSTLLFASRADLTGYESGGFAEIYRYSTAGQLQCLSCTPSGLPPSSDASLQTIKEGLFAQGPSGKSAEISNLMASGRRAFFQSSEPLALEDTDQRQDVYEWEASGVGSCTSAGGCVRLIGSPHSGRDDYLYALSQSGDDAFILSADQLTGSDPDATPSIFDARVNGGFPEAQESSCQAEGCKPPLSSPPALAPPASPASATSGNLAPAKKGKRCPKGKRKVKRKGKVRCVRKQKHRRHHKHHKRHKRAGKAKKGGRK